MRRAICAVLGFLVVVGGSALAHHGYADFDRNRTVTIEGELQELLYANPHIVMKVRTASDVYTVSWESPNSVSRRIHFTATTFKIGDHLSVTGSPSRDASAHILALVREVVRPSDGWRWGIQPAAPSGTN